MFTCTKYGDATDPAANTGVMVAGWTFLLQLQFPITHNVFWLLLTDPLSLRQKR
jgi:hypothetical protein